MGTVTSLLKHIWRRLLKEEGLDPALMVLPPGYKCRVSNKWVRTYNRHIGRHRAVKAAQAPAPAPSPFRRW